MICGRGSVLSFTKTRPTLYLRRWWNDASGHTGAGADGEHRGEDFNMSNVPTEARDPPKYDIEHETADSRNMLEKRIPAKLNAIKLALIEIDKRLAWEPWRLALMVDLIEGIEGNCDQLLQTMKQSRLQASAW